MKNVRKKSRNYKLLTLPLMSVVLICTTNCEKEIDVGLPNLEHDPFGVEQAEEWFKTNYNENVIMVSHGRLNAKSFGKSSSIKNVELKPKWEKAISSSKGQEQTVEIYLDSEEFFGWASEESREKFIQTNNSKYLESLSRLVILHNKKENTTRSFIMTIVAGTNYFESKNFKLASNTYFKKDHNFTGYIFFHTVAGNFINSWSMEQGEVLGTLTPKGIGVSNKSSSDCTQMGMYEYFATCDMYYHHATEEWSVIQGTCDVDQELVYEWEECFTNYEGSTPPSVGPLQGVYTLAKPEMKKNMEKQMPNTCVTAILGYISEEFCGGSKDQNYYMQEYFELSGEHVMLSGFGIEHLDGFMNTHFNVEPPSGITLAIDAGKVIMVDRPSPIPGSSHNVLIVGYKDNGDFIYMDPQEGKFMEDSMNSFSYNYAFIITGCN